jgi:methionyl-tRNA formyltransferase
LRIIFAGTPANAARTLELALLAGVDIVGVLTRTDTPKGRNGVVTESPVAEIASRNGLDVFKSNGVSQEARTWISSKNPDLGVIVAYGSILKSDALEIPVHGWINVHYSLLPEYPGASPVQHALMDGKSATGVTIFKLDDGIDTGPILASRSSEISPEATTGSLLEQLTELGAHLLLETLADFDRSLASKVEQKRDAVEVVTRKIHRSMARIDFNLSSLKVANFIRAMNPEPIAWFEFDSIPIRVLDAQAVQGEPMTVGHAKVIDGALLVGCADGLLELKLVQPAGKKPMNGADWFRGLRQELLLLS